MVAVVPESIFHMIEENVQATNGPSWLQVVRRSAAKRFADSGIPKSSDEEWKYTSLRDFGSQPWGPAPVAHGEGRWFCPDSHRVLVVNGRLAMGSCSEANLKVGGLDDTELAELASRHLGSCGPVSTETSTRTIEPGQHPLADFNLATFEEALIIELRGQVNQTVEICHVLTLDQDKDANFVCTPRTLIVAQPGSQAKLIETYVTGVCSPNAFLSATEVVVEAGAHLEHVRIQDQCLCSTHIGNWQAKQGKDSTYLAYNVVLGGKLARLDQGIWIGGEGCTTRLDGVVVASKAQHVDNHTRLDHAVPNCNSFEIYKQVVADEATVVFNGKIFVHQDAQKTDAKQTNQALLMSPKATINSKPQLEIFADDVKCTHGATVGQLEDLPLFYMRSRGMEKDEAQALLVYAFAAEVIELITIEPLKQKLEERLYEKLGVAGK